mmetsp:Transcript_31547/g.96570  ORF Transcript_31547/g.96570 Transcript_31547/m.96570 type:complete len:127 (-) Transcript_31547:2811-3191(-)
MPPARQASSSIVGGKGGEEKDARVLCLRCCGRRYDDAPLLTTNRERTWHMENSPSRVIVLCCISNRRCPQAPRSGNPLGCGCGFLPRSLKRGLELMNTPLLIGSLPIDALLYETTSSALPEMAPTI